MIRKPSQFAFQKTGCPTLVRGPHGQVFVHGVALATILWLGWVGAAMAQAPPPSAPVILASAPVILDRVVAVVNNHAILASDVDEEIRLAVIDPGQAGLGVLTPKRALEQLIGRALIQQQIRQEDAQAAAPPQAEVEARIAEIRRELPACVHENCASDSGWKAFLAEHGLAPERVESYLRYRVQILRFIELRFRQGIRIPQQDIQAYYNQMLLPEYTPGESIPSLDTVAPRIEEILLQRQVNALFDDWLTDLRKQGDIEVIDPALETQAAPESQVKGDASQ
jgi:peptidyl-prolyl cis-trans isomerase SurA